MARKKRSHDEDTQSDQELNLDQESQDQDQPDQPDTEILAPDHMVQDDANRVAMDSKPSQSPIVQKFGANLSEEKKAELNIVNHKKFDKFKSNK